MSDKMSEEQGKEPDETGNSADGCIIDTSTGLMWQKEDDGVERNFRDAIQYCDELSLGGYTDWRLPTADELKTIFDPYSETKHSSPFINAKPERYWSITIIFDPGAASPIAYTLDFASGSQTTYFQSYEYYVRAVRGRSPFY